MENNIFTASSGNRATIRCAAVGRDNTSLAVGWKQMPTERDMAEFDEWFRRDHPELRTMVSRNVTGERAEDVAARMQEFAATGRLSLPEEN